MLNSLLDRYKHFRDHSFGHFGAGKSQGRPKVDTVLNHIYLQLHQAQRSRSFVEVQVEDDDVIYQSIILSVDPEERTLLIDELFPNDFVGLAGQRVRISIRQNNGRKLKFNSVIREQYLDDGTPLYVLTMPEDLQTDQRRSSYRLPIGNNTLIESQFTGPDQQSYPAKLRNLSSSGISMEVAVNNIEDFDLHYNDKLSHLQFDFAGINVDCGLAVRNVEPLDEAHQSVLIGAEFVDIGPLEQRGLEKSIMRIQRDRIRYAGELESRMAVVD